LMRGGLAEAPPTGVAPEAEREPAS
jgi:hypothetical protein